MKNLKKLLPIFAFVLGVGLVFTQSAFKGVKLTEYGYDPTNSTGLAVNGWVDLTLLTPDDGNHDSGTYYCDGSTDICKGIFDSAPEEEEIPEDATPGVFAINQ
jgi:hypothetical protein